MNSTLKNTLLVASGIVVGAITGILTAPKSGKETRADIQKKIDDLQTRIKELSGEARVQVEQKISVLKNSLKELEAQLSN